MTDSEATTAVNHPHKHISTQKKKHDFFFQIIKIWNINSQRIKITGST